MSNKTTAKYLESLIDENTEYIILAHLSEKNNTEQLALETTRERINNKEIKILIARQDEMGPLIEV